MDRTPRPALTTRAQANLADIHRLTMAAVRLAIHADIPISAAAAVLEACAEPEPKKDNEQ